MGFIFDIAIVSFFLFIVYTGYKRGLFLSLMSFASIILQFFAAKFFAGYVSGYLYENFVKSHFTDKLLAEFSHITGMSAEALDVGKLLNEQPVNFINIIQSYGFDVYSVRNFFEQGTRQTAENVNHYVAENIITPAAKSLTDFLSFCLVFVVAGIILKIIISAVDKILELPVLKTINRTGGLLAGIVFGTVFSLILTALLIQFMPYFITLTKDPSAENFLKSSFIFAKLRDFISSGLLLNP